MLDPALLRTGTWQGTPNRLNANHVCWEVIDGVATATWKPRTPTVPRYSPSPLPETSTTSSIPAARLIRQRRSCLALDGKTALDAGDFYAMLDHTLPRPGVPPWDVLPWTPHLHLGIFGSAAAFDSLVETSYRGLSRVGRKSPNYCRT